MSRTKFHEMAALVSAGLRRPTMRTPFLPVSGTCRWMTTLASTRSRSSWPKRARVVDGEIGRAQRRTERGGLVDVQDRLVGVPGGALDVFPADAPYGGGGLRRQVDGGAGPGDPVTGGQLDGRQDLFLAAGGVA
ncbi:hypothetical protein [Kribbella qitaiheensis]|uniref:hypothetical protein n=1 Tax=Kribbella qitaiheensis TaxID=1544730 RepID=UPI001629BDBA|nr:hypothetical protein [Kribbella qitaiheensis]